MGMIPANHFWGCPKPFIPKNKGSGRGCLLIQPVFEAREFLTNMGLSPTSGNPNRVGFLLVSHLNPPKGGSPPKKNDTLMCCQTKAELSFSFSPIAQFPDIGCLENMVSFGTIHNHRCPFLVLHLRLTSPCAASSCTSGLPKR